MRPTKLSFELAGHGSYSILGSFNQLASFVEFSSSTMHVAAMTPQCSAPSFKLAGDAWVQFSNPSWEEMTIETAKEMVECWNEKYADDKWSPMREELSSFQSYCWGLENILSELSESEDCPPKFSNEAKRMMENQKKEMQITWDTSQTKVQYLEGEILRLKEVIKSI